MNTFTTILLALLAAALLGNVIGWCCRRLVAIKNENRLTEQFTRQKQLINEQLQDANDENQLLREELENTQATVKSRESELLGGRQSAQRAEAVEADLTQQVESSQLELLRLEDQLNETLSHAGDLEGELDDLRQQNQSLRAAQSAAQSTTQASGASGIAANTAASDVDLPVLSRKHGPDVLPDLNNVGDEFARNGALQDDTMAHLAQVDPVNGIRGQTAGQSTDQAAGLAGNGHDTSPALDTGKYLFPPIDDAPLEVDDDIKVLSQTGAHRVPESDAQEWQQEDSQSANPFQAESSGHDLSSQLTEEDRGRTSSETATEPAREPAQGLFSRFNKRKH